MKVRVKSLASTLKTLKEKQIPELRRKLGVVFQDFKLLNDRNVKQNLEFVLKATGWKDKSRMDKRIDDVLKKVGMQTKHFKFPYPLIWRRTTTSRQLPELYSTTQSLSWLTSPQATSTRRLLLKSWKCLQDINKNGNTILMATHDYALLLKYPSKTLKCDGQKVFEVVQKKNSAAKTE